MQLYETNTATWTHPWLSFLSHGTFNLLYLIHFTLRIHSDSFHFLQFPLVLLLSKLSTPPSRFCFSSPPFSHVIEMNLIHSFAQNHPRTFPHTQSRSQSHLYDHRATIRPLRCLWSLAYILHSGLLTSLQNTTPQCLCTCNLPPAPLDIHTHTISTQSPLSSPSGLHQTTLSTSELLHWPLYWQTPSFSSSPSYTFCFSFLPGTYHYLTCGTVCFFWFFIVDLITQERKPNRGQGFLWCYHCAWNCTWYPTGT